MAMSITDADLHAFVDGELSGRMLDEVRRHVALDGRAALLVQRWAAGRDALRTLLEPVAEEPLPLRLRLARLEPALSADGEARRGILFALGFLAGFVIGLGIAAALLLLPRLF